MKRFFKNQQSYAFLAVFGTFSLLSFFSCLDTFGVNDVNGTMVGDEKTTLATNAVPTSEEEAISELEELQQSNSVESETPEEETDQPVASPEAQKPEEEVNQAKTVENENVSNELDEQTSEAEGKEKAKNLPSEEMGKDKTAQESDKDESTNPTELTPCETLYLDSDGDGFGNPDEPEEFCLSEGQNVSGEYNDSSDEYDSNQQIEWTQGSPLEAYVSNDADCDDKDAGINPDAEEVYGDNVDNNCNGSWDEFLDLTTVAVDSSKAKENASDAKKR